jgi:hypothetical protein
MRLKIEHVVNKNRAQAQFYYVLPHSWQGDDIRRYYIGICSCSLIQSTGSRNYELPRLVHGRNHHRAHFFQDKLD